MFDLFRPEHDNFIEHGRTAAKIRQCECRIPEITILRDWRNPPAIIENCEHSATLGRSHTSLGDRVQGSDLPNHEAHGDDLHRLSPTPGATAPTALQRLNAFSLRFERAILQMAPMAGGVADTQQDRAVQALGRGQRVWPHFHQSTGFGACWSRYGDWDWARPLTITPSCHAKLRSPRR